MAKTINYYNSDSAPDEFVGARVYETHVDFYFPHGYVVDLTNSEECKKKALNILYLVTLSASSYNEDSFSSEANEKTNKYPLKSFLWLVKDYFDNGLITAVEKLYQKNGNGRISWSRTFKTTPFLMQKKLFYLDLTTEYKAKTDDVLTFIHDYCLRIALREIGWIFGIRNTPCIISELTDNQKLYYERCLLREQNRTFNDHKKVLIRHLLRVLKHSLGKKDYSDRSEIGTYKFCHVWEKMIQEVYGNKPLNEFFPNAIWHIKGVVKDSSHLRPDTVMEYDNRGEKRLYILDAKYYKYGIYDNIDLLPGSSDVQKQITYGDHAKYRHAEYEGRIKNAFILPFCSCFMDKVQNIGYAESNWREGEDSHQKVHLILIDSEYLIDAFLAGKHGGVYMDEIARVIDGGVGGYGGRM